jgi:DNA modification methylase
MIQRGLEFGDAPDYEILAGDCLEVMAAMDADSVDSIVSDPPYGLSAAKNSGKSSRGGFMGKEWDHGVPGVEFWTEALRVAKPGAHLLAFGGTRTYHRLACAIEDAGWEIRDCVMWVYGSGFPKSHDASKAIDRRGGATAGFKEFRDAVKDAMKRNGVSRTTLSAALGNHMLSHYLTAGSQPAVPNAKDYRIIRDTVGLGRDWDHLFMDEAEREVVGFQKRGSAVNTSFMSGGNDITAPATPEAQQWAGWGTALKPAWEPIIVARKPLCGTVAENVLAHGTGGINVDGCRVGTETITQRLATVEGGKAIGAGAVGVKQKATGETTTTIGRWPANVIHDGSDEVVGLFPQAAGGKFPAGGKQSKGSDNAYGTFNGNGQEARSIGDTGSAARFFYCPKASKADRDEGCEGLIVKDVHRYGAGLGEGIDPNAPARNRNHHPTVKPTALMRYLCRLVTPPGGIVLDPFMGSGSTGKAAMLEGFRFIGIEREAEYVEIARARIGAVLS